MKTKEEQAALNKSIVDYAERLDVENVLRLLKEGADVNAIDDDNETLLTIVAKTYITDYVPHTFDSLLSIVKDEKGRNKVIAMKEMFEKDGYDFSGGKIAVPSMDELMINLSDHAINKRIELMKILLKHGADINLGNEDGINAMFYAVSNVYPEMVDFLLQNGADPNINYFPGDESGIYETILDKAYIDLQIAEGNLRDFGGYAIRDGMDEELTKEYIDNFKKCIELLKNAGAK